MYLMYKDKKVLFFDLEDFNAVVLNRDLLPYYLKGLDFQSPAPKDIFYNIQELRGYLSSRVLSLSRKNAKQLYALFQIPQSNDIGTRVDICLKCRGVSIQDSYWIKIEENEVWKDYNIRQNKLKEIIDIALYGNHPSVSVSPICPELTTKGLFPKGWVRQDNELYLLKTDNTVDFVNTRMEVLASKILSCFNIRYVEYTGRMRTTESGKVYVDKSANYVTEDISFIDAFEVMEYCRRLQIDFEQECLEQFGSDFANIPVIDYILANTDRHTQNYGFFQNDLGALVCVSPLFDFNNALVSDYFQRDVSDTMSQMFNKKESIYDCMKRYLPYSKLTFDLDRFQSLRSKNKEYIDIFDRVLTRIKVVGLV